MHAKRRSACSTGEGLSLVPPGGAHYILMLRLLCRCDNDLIRVVVEVRRKQC